MSYVNSALMPGETVIETARIHWFIFVPDMILLLIAFWFYQSHTLLTMVMVLFVIYLFARDLIYFFTTELALTNKRVIAKFGWIKRDTIELNLTRVESLSVSQSIFGRIFNFGTLIINGIGGVRTPIPIIENPLTFRSRTLDLLDKMK